MQNIHSQLQKTTKSNKTEKRKPTGTKKNNLKESTEHEKEAKRSEHSAFKTHDPCCK
jgi:hypothetical protein